MAKQIKKTTKPVTKKHNPVVTTIETIFAIATALTSTKTLWDIIKELKK